MARPLTGRWGRMCRLLGAGVAGQMTARPSTLRTRSSARRILTVRSEGEGDPGLRSGRAVDASTMGFGSSRARRMTQIELMQVYEGLKQFDNAIAAAIPWCSVRDPRQPGGAGGDVAADRLDWSLGGGDPFC